MKSYDEKQRPDSIGEVVDMSSEMKDILSETEPPKLLHGHYGLGKSLTAEILLRQREEA